MPEELACVNVSDDQLAARIRVLAAGERRTLAVLLLHIAEFDRRRLHEKAGFRTLWEYCTRELGYSESSALKRIVAARLLRQFPAILPLLDEGRIHLSALVILSAHLTPENHLDLLGRAQGKSKRELEFLAAGLAPNPDARDMVRIQPLSADRALIRFTGGREFLDLLGRARELLCGSHPARSLEWLFAEALKTLLEARDPLRVIRRKRLRGKGKGPSELPAPSPASRRIPAAVRDAVFLRDEGRCTFVGVRGRRCMAGGGLEVDHIIPWAMGGRSDDINNLRLLCREHNLSEARRIFGDEFMARRMRGDAD